MYIAVVAAAAAATAAATQAIHRKTMQNHMEIEFFFGMILITNVIIFNKKKHGSSYKTGPFHVDEDVVQAVVGM